MKSNVYRKNINNLFSKQLYTIYITSLTCLSAAGANVHLFTKTLRNKNERIRVVIAHSRIVSFCTRQIIDRARPTSSDAITANASRRSTRAGSPKTSGWDA